MWGEWRLTLRKAEHALKIGRLDEAVGYVTRPEVLSYRQTRELAVRVTEALAVRAEGHLQRGDAQRAWRDLEQAEKLNCLPDRVGGVRQNLVQNDLKEARTCLNGGQPEAAITILDRLNRRGAVSTEVSRLRDASAAWRNGAEQARAGHFGPAIEHFEKARIVITECEALDNALQQAWAARDRLVTLEANLHRALGADDDSAALAVADEILTVAPAHLQARAARRQAWQAVGVPVTVAGGAAMNGHIIPIPRDARTVIRPTGMPLVASDAETPPDAMRSERSGERFLCWIDGVGGYLVCLGDRVSLGQPAGWHVDIPIMADLSRLHAWIERDGEGYLFRAVRPASVNGMPVREKSVLGDDCEILMGQGMRIRFRRPNPLSATARLELTSSHRLSLPADAVVLMAETFIIGPTAGAHVPAPEWKHEVVLYRQAESLWCRAAGDFEVDGQSYSNRARISSTSRVRGEGFSLAFEPLQSENNTHRELGMGGRS
jgi:tetratricopeptide (TPR) repeat protein